MGSVATAVASCATNSQLTITAESRRHQCTHTLQTAHERTQGGHSQCGGTTRCCCCQTVHMCKHLSPGSPHRAHWPGAQPTAAPASCQSSGDPSFPVQDQQTHQRNMPRFAPGCGLAALGIRVPAPHSAAQRAAPWNPCTLTEQDAGASMIQALHASGVRGPCCTPPLGHSGPHSGEHCTGHMLPGRTTGHTLAAGAAAKNKGEWKPRAPGHTRVVIQTTLPSRRPDDPALGGCVPTTTATKHTCTQPLTHANTAHTHGAEVQVHWLHIPFAPARTGGYAGCRRASLSHTCTGVFRSTGHRRTPRVGWVSGGCRKHRAPRHTHSPRPMLQGGRGFERTTTDTA